MFRQSIDPKGSFPPRSTNKPVKKKKGTKKPKIKRRKRTKDRFASERRAEQVFRFGERRSGLSGRTLYKPEGRTEPRQPPPSRNDSRNNFNPADYLRIHNQAIKNQLRDIAETKSTGGTFTGTSIGEERRVKEAKEADLEFKRQEADTRRRFVGAVEKFVDKVSVPAPAPAPVILPAPAPAPIRLPDREIVEELRDIKKELKKKPVPVIKFGDDDPVEELFGVADIEDITIRERRPPEDDINYLATTRSKRSPTPIPPVPAPRPSPSNPIDAKGRAEIEAIRTSINTPFRVPEPEPEPEEATPEGRRKLFLEEQGDTDEFLTPLESPPPKAPPTEIPIIPPPLSAGIPQPKSDTEIVDIAKKVKAEKEGKKVKEEKPRTPNPANERQEGETEQDFLDRIGKIPDPSTSGKSAEEINLDARLENYKELAKFSETRKGLPKNFDNEKQHYRLQVLEDIEPEELGRQRRQAGFKKGQQFRLQRTDYKGQAIANRGFYFYNDDTGKQLKPTQKNLFKVNLANPKVDKKFQESIKQGKIKIVFDEFDDGI